MFLPNCQLLLLLVTDCKGQALAVSRGGIIASAWYNGGGWCKLLQARVMRQGLDFLAIADIHTLTWLSIDTTAL